MKEIASIKQTKAGNIKLEYKKICCPLCKGKGKIVPIHKLTQEQKAQIIIALRKSRFSYRDIMKLLGYKSTNSVAKLLEKEQP